MWLTINRARRRITGAAPAPDPRIAVGDPSLHAALVPARPVEDVVIILGALEFDHLREALQGELGDAVDRPNTPDRLERALSLLLGRWDAPGRPRVLRRPAAISTPESWEIHLDGVERATGTAVREAGRTGSFAA